MGNAIFNPIPKESVPLNHCQISVTGDYIADSYHHTVYQIWCKSLHGSLGRLHDKRVKYNQFKKIILLFENLPTIQTLQRIIVFDDSNDADWYKGCLLGALLILHPIYGVRSSKKQILGWIGVFKPNMQNVETFILSISNSLPKKFFIIIKTTLCGWSKKP